MSSTSYSGTLWWFSNKTRNDGIHTCSEHSQGSSWNFQFNVESGLIIHWEKTRSKNPVILVTLFVRKYISIIIGKTINMQSARSRIALLADKNHLQSAPMTVPGDSIDRVTAQNGDRVLFERLATPRATAQGDVEE